MKILLHKRRKGLTTPLTVEYPVEVSVRETFQEEIEYFCNGSCKKSVTQRKELIRLKQTFHIPSIKDCACGGEVIKRS